MKQVLPIKLLYTAITSPLTTVRSLRAERCLVLTVLTAPAALEVSINSDRISRYPFVDYPNSICQLLRLFVLNYVLSCYLLALLPCHLRTVDGHWMVDAN